MRAGVANEFDGVNQMTLAGANKSNNIPFTIYDVFNEVNIDSSIDHI